MKICALIICLLTAVTAGAQHREVSPQTMQQVYEEIKTPYKYGLVIAPDSNRKADCPSVYREGKWWYMTYIVFDGKGYETWLAKSADLLEWETLGRLMSFTDTGWDANQKAGYTALQDYHWGGSNRLEKYDGKYWMSYIGGHETGYESGALAIGLAHTPKPPTTAHEWQRLPQPVLKPTDADTRWWENLKLYKSTIIHDKSRTTGYPFVMYYNANGDTSGNKPKWRWFERIGMAVSEDMVNWKRFGIEPVVHHPVGLTADPVIQKIKDVWVMFYFGAFWEGRKDAFNRFACSYDLVHWTDWQGDDLVRPSELYDERFAHKSFVVKHKGVVYHFYCAVDSKDRRGIAVAVSQDKGKSKLHF